MMTTDSPLTLPSGMQAGSLELLGVRKNYHPKGDGPYAVEEANLTIKPGTFVTFLGPSGCGKTTTLRMIAGFEQPTEGEILLDGQDVTIIPPEKRPMSMVFQSYALFPHLTVRDNVAYGLKLKKTPKTEVAFKIDEALETMGISQFAERYPHQLSGGQQQRVALARALIMEPKIVLFDEPLSNLDARLRVRMRREIRDIQQRLGLTAIFVTHDQSEALTMSDVIVVMSEGRIEQVGSPTEVYRRPANRFVASFMGTSNFLKGKVKAEVPDAEEITYVVDTALGELSVHGVPGLDRGQNCDVVVRAEDLRVDSPGPAAIHFEAEVVNASFDGSVIHYALKTPAGEMAGTAPGSGIIRDAGASVQVAIENNSLWVVAADGGRA